MEILQSHVSLLIVPIIACGGEDSKVHLFTEKDDKVCNLQSSAGHSLGTAWKVH